MFSLVDAALIRPLPFPDSRRLVMVWERAPQFPRNRVAPLNFLDWSEQNRAFTAMAATAGTAPGPLVVSAGEAPDTVFVQSVTAGFFEVLGVPPLTGRTFVPADAVDGVNAAVVSERLWRTRFGMANGFVGRVIRIGSAGTVFTVVGIMPADFQILERADVWTVLPVRRTPDQRRLHYLQVIARLKPDVDLDRARADMNVVTENIERAAPDTNKGLRATIDPIQVAIVGDELRTTSLVLGSIVIFVLLLACANVANLLLARGIGRTREIAVRAALGGSRSRILRQLLTESVLLASLGGAGGLALSWVILRVAPSVVPPRTIPESIVLGLDGRVAAFGVMVTFATALVFGVAPAWHGASIPLVGAMSVGGRGASDRAGRLRQALAVLEIAAALLLMTGAGVLLRTLWSLNSVDGGYRADHVLTMSVGTGINRYRSQQDLAAFYQRLEGEVSSVAGVRLASLTSDVPLDGFSFGEAFEVVGQRPTDPAQRVAAHYQIITPGYFNTLGIPLLRGRAFTDADSGATSPVCIVNEEFVHRYLTERDPIGARVSVQAMSLRPGAPVVREVVGVIQQVKTRPGEIENAVEIYVPLAQNPWFKISATLAVQSAVAPMSLLPAIKTAIARVDPLQVVTRVRTMDEVAAESTARPRFRAQIVTTLAALALLLASIGIFSVLSFTVQQRAREFAIRLAIGADGADIMRLVVCRGLLLTACG
jgi:putative ABC transport system permease protein